MSTPTRFRPWRVRLALACCAALLLDMPLCAQTLSSPIAPSATASSPPAQGPGYHSPLSPFKPLEEREGVVSWKLLGQVTTRPVNKRLEPVFPPAVKALSQQTVKIQGFMMPLEASARQKHFLLTSVPPTCAFCVPAGPEGMVEIHSKTSVAYGLEPVTVQGTLQVLQDDAKGLYYRISDARPVSP